MLALAVAECMESIQSKGAGTRIAWSCVCHVMARYLVPASPSWGQWRMMCAMKPVEIAKTVLTCCSAFVIHAFVGAIFGPAQAWGFLSVVCAPWYIGSVYTGFYWSLIMNLKLNVSLIGSSRMEECIFMLIACPLGCLICCSGIVCLKVQSE